jgi:hypothetical protein
MPSLHGQRLAHAEPHPFKRGRCGPNSQHIAFWLHVDVLDAEKAVVGFVEVIPPDDALVEQVSRVADMLCKLAISGQEVILEPVLDVLSVDDALWRIVAAGPEERVERLHSQAGVVCGPDHGGEVGGIWPCRVGPLWLEDSSVCCGEVARVEATGDQGPVRRTAPPREAGELENSVRKEPSSQKERKNAYEVLVRIHIDTKAIFLDLAEESDCVVEIGGVVDTRTLVLDGLPDGDIAQSCVPPFSEAGKVDVSLSVVEIEHPPDEAQLAALRRFPEPAELLEGLSNGRLCRGCQVRATEQQGPAAVVAKISSIRVHEGRRARIAWEEVRTERNGAKGRWYGVPYSPVTGLFEGGNGMVAGRQVERCRRRTDRAQHRSKKGTSKGVIIH